MLYELDRLGEREFRRRLGITLPNEVTSHMRSIPQPVKESQESVKAVEPLAVQAVVVSVGNFDILTVPECNRLSISEPNTSPC